VVAAANAPAAFAPHALVAAMASLGASAAAGIRTAPNPDIWRASLSTPRMQIS